MSTDKGSMNFADRYRRWFDYEQDAHSWVLDALEKVPESLRITPEFSRAVELAAHIVHGRRIWMSRLTAGPRPASKLFEQGLTLDELRARFQNMHQEWSGYLAGLTDDDLARQFEYERVPGEPHRNMVEDALTQLFTHSAYHRGHIAGLLRQIGAQPATTDFIHWCRQQNAKTASGG